MPQSDRQRLIDTISDVYGKALDRVLEGDPRTLTEIEAAIDDLQQEVGQGVRQAFLDERGAAEEESNRPGVPQPGAHSDE